MPIFEYSCSKCGFSFERLVKITGTNKIAACPNCKSKKTVKLFSRFGFKSKSGLISSSNKRCGSCASGHCSSCG